MTGTVPTDGPLGRGPLAALLEGVVDYAGLFPPASLPMTEAVERYAAHANGPYRSLLGRFVLPVARLGEFRRAAGSRGLDADSPGRPSAGVPIWRLAALAVPDDAPEIVRFNAAHHGRFLVDTVEAKASDVETIWRLASAFDESMMVYVELPVRPDPSVLIAELGARSLRAKIRTGGVTADAFPSPVEVLRFLAACARNGVAFKATAGLHHPLRGEYALSYEDDAARGTMYGFLNVFVAAALLYDGVDEVELVPLLEERDRAAFKLTGDSITWRGRSVDVDEITRARRLRDVVRLVLIRGAGAGPRGAATSSRALMSPIDQTHDVGLRSWVASAHADDADFTIQNLPLGVFRARTGAGVARIGVAIGDRIVDLCHARDAGYLDGLRAELVTACGGSSLNGVFGLGRSTMTALRARVSAMLCDGTAEGARARVDADLTLAMADAEMLVPCEVGDYTDFYASIDHATNVGSMFRPDNPLLPNYKHVPIGYHGRASSIVVSGTPVRRPSGQTAAKPEGPPAFGPSRRMDYELEVGAFIGTGNALGAAIPLDEAEAHIAGLVLVNDWSARDLQTWEYQPLGPFLAKNFATSVAPWVVTMDALEPFRAAARPRGKDDPPVLPYLVDEGDAARGGFAITLEVWLRTARMRAAGAPAERLSRGSFERMYWTLAQMLTHHASNGCNLRAGDLIASGTVSGPEKDSRGCLLELSWKGTEPIRFSNDEERTFLADGDEVIMKGWCDRPGAARVGLGECRGVVQSHG